MFKFLKKSKKAVATTQVEEPVVEKIEETVSAPIYTVDHITDDEFIQRALDILLEKVVPTMDDWQTLRDETTNIYNRLREIYRTRPEEDPGFGKLTDYEYGKMVAYKAYCDDYLLTMAFRKAWYINNPDRAAEDADHHRLLSLTSSTPDMSSWMYHQHYQEFDYPSTGDVAWLDMDNNMKPYTQWAKVN